MSKIMLIANDTTYTYNLRRELIIALVEKYKDVVVVCKELILKDELSALGCRLIDIETGRHGTNPFSDVILYKNLLEILKQEKPNVVLTFNIKPNVYGGMACKKLSIPYIPNITGLGKAVEYNSFLQKITIPLYRAGISRAACIFFQNEENRKFALDHKMITATTKTKLLPGSGVSLEMHKAMSYPPEETGINFLFIARIMKEKGIDLYLNAAKVVHEKYPNTTFHICGLCDDKKYIDILSEAEKDGYIKYHGEQKDMRPFFEMAHCIVHPSYYPEGMSNVLLEAAAHARPIIAADRAGCRETVDNKKSGYLVSVKDQDSLNEAVFSFLRLSFEEKAELGLNGRSKVENEFDRNIVVRKYIDEIEEIIRR